MERMADRGLALNENALQVLAKRYLRKDLEGVPIESAEDMFRRVARTIARADLAYDRSLDDVKETETTFYDMITALDFLPNSPTLMNAGRRLGQLSACFVLPVEDSMDSIFDAVKSAALIHKSGGGTGFSFSRLRPRGDVVGSTKGVSSGPLSFMTVFDTATETIKQGGTRRGANMGLLRVDHPDILDFITSKDHNAKLNNFNISVGLTEQFMEAVEQDGDYDLINPHSGNRIRSVKARMVFETIVQHAWKNGEPGIVFLDRMNRDNPTPEVGEIEATNPCGEQPLLPFESCNLGSINLSKMVTGGNVDWDHLRDVVHRAVHFLDNVIDVNRYPLPIIEEMTKANRKIGLGVMGWADMLIQLGIPYNTTEAFELGEKVMGFVQAEGRKASMALADERGAFPNFSSSIYRNGPKVRNATVTTIAPTGTLSIIAGCSSGIEPLFAVSFVRNVLDGARLVEVNPQFERVAREQGFYSEELIEKISEHGSLKDVEGVPEDVARVFVTAHDITPEVHIRMQAAFQQSTDNAVSKTVNFPNSATVKDVENVYRLAYKTGCKGVTVYRDGSRDEQVLSTGATAGNGSETAERAEEPRQVSPRKRPEVIRGGTRLLKTGCGNLYVTINEDDEGNLFELFTQMGKAGGCAASQAEAIGRLVSLAFRSGISAAEITKQLKGISCHNPQWSESGRILSCSDAIAIAVERYRQQAVNEPVAAVRETQESGGRGKPDSSHANGTMLGACPDCGGQVEHESGCVLCRSCGFTRCG